MREESTQDGSGPVGRRVGEPGTAWTGLVDLVHPVGGPKGRSWRLEWSLVVGRYAVADEALAQVPDDDGPLRVVLGGGAGRLAGPAAYARRRGLRLAALDTTLRDPADPAGNVRRVLAALDAARADGAVDDDVAVHVRVPADLVGGAPGGAALRVLDELAAADLVLALPLPLAGPALIAWLDAAMDREVACSLVGGAPADAEAALVAAARLWDPPAAPDAPDAVVDPAGGRRWVRAWLTDDLAAVHAHLDLPAPGTP